MIKRIKKYKTIYERVISQEKEIERLKSYNNHLLNTLLDTITKVKSNKFDKEEEAIFRSLESYRERLCLNEDVITYEIFNSELRRTVREVAKISASSPL